MQEVKGSGEVSLAPDGHLLQPLLAHARATPDRPLLLFREGASFRTLSAGEVVRRVRLLARGLMALAVGPGQRVALMSRTRLEWVLLDYAILATGAATVPLYETSSAEQVEWVLRDGEAGVALFETERVRALVPPEGQRPPTLRTTLSLEEGALPRLEALGAGVEEAQLDARLAGLTVDQPAAILYTSGTTGRPRGCVLSHRNLRSNALQVAQRAEQALGPDDRMLLFLPLAHALARILLLVAVERGSEVALAGDPGRLSEELALARPTWLGAVPRVLEKVYEGARQRAADAGRGRLFALADRVAVDVARGRTAGRVPLHTRLLHRGLDVLVYRRLRALFGGRLRFVVSGGGPLAERLNLFLDGAGIQVHEGYGLTETSPVLTLNVPGRRRIGSVGQPLPGTTVRIAEDGEVLARGPQVFEGYWHEPALAHGGRDAEGWFHTGDLGTLDEAGFLRLTGRKKEILVTAAGKNVAPGPLEDRLRQHPLVSQAMVVGEGRPFVAALLTLDAQAFRRWAREHGRDPEGLAQLVEDPELRAEVGRAVEAANTSVSRAESIRAFAILPRDFTLEEGELTPTQKVRRHVVARNHAAALERLYAREA